MMIKRANPSVKPSACSFFIDGSTIDAAVSSPQLSSYVRKHKEISSKVKGNADGPLQVRRVYVHNTPDGPIWFPFSSIDLDRGGANGTRLYATG